jgi:hypothetical protein
MPARDATIHGSDPIGVARMHTAMPSREPTCIAPHSTAHRLLPTSKKRTAFAQRMRGICFCS